MVSQVFKNLSKEKQKAIIEACIDEFADFGFEQASTNRIVKNLGIAKGSLFKYFGTKEDIYFFLVDEVLGDFLDEMERRRSILSHDLFDRMKQIIDISFDMYFENLRYLRFFMILADSKNSGLFMKFMQIYGPETPKLKSYYEVMFNISDENLRLEVQKSLKVVSWTISGLKLELNMGLNAQTDVKEIRQKYMDALDLAFDALRYGMLKQES